VSAREKVLSRECFRENTSACRACLARHANGELPFGKSTDLWGRTDRRRTPLIIISLHLKRAGGLDGRPLFVVVVPCVFLSAGASCRTYVGLGLSTDMFTAFPRILILNVFLLLFRTLKGPLYGVSLLVYPV